MEKNEVVRIELTNEQQAQVKEVVGQEAKAIELTVKELEERIAPIVRW